MKSLFLPLIFIYFSQVSFSQTYYVSPHGNDSNNGTSSATPWKTLNQVSANINAGVTFLFEEGEVFHGQIDIPLIGSKTYSNIIFDSYPSTHGGTTAKPIISGTDTVSGVWTQTTGKPGVWEITYSNQPKMVFINGKEQVLARFPNWGSLAHANQNQTGACPWGGTNVKCSDNYNLLSNDLASFSAGHFDGGILRLRTSNWSWEAQEITSHTVWTNGDGILTWSNIFNQTQYHTSGHTGWGFYIDNLFDELDTVGEWFYDTNTNKLYVYPPTGANPNSLDIEASIYNYGIIANGTTNSYDKFNVSNIKFEKQAKESIHAEAPNDITINNCDFENIFSRAIYMEGGDNCIVSNSTFKQIRDGGIYARTYNSVISDCQFENIGSVPGYMEEIGGAEGGTAIDVRTCAPFMGPCTTKGFDILRNTFDTIGHCAIAFRGGQNLIQYNYIKNAMYILDDGGAIYSFGFKNSYPTTPYSRNSIVRDNIIDHTPGGFYGKPFSQQNPHLTAGIYLDNQVDSTKVIHNTVIKSGNMGQFVNTRNNDNLIDSNTYFGFHYNGIRIAEGMSGIWTYDNTITNNIFYTLDSNTLAIARLIGNDGATRQKAIGDFDENIYATPFNYNIPMVEHGNTASSLNDMNFSQWLSWKPTDNTLSDTIDVQYLPGTDPYDKHKIFYNATMTTASITLTKDYNDIYGNQVCTPLILDPFHSKILIEVGTTPCSTTGINKVSDNNFMIYPNPANEYITLKSKDNIISYEIYSYEGKVIDFQDNLSNNEVKLSISDLIKGVYYIKINTSNYGASTGTFIKN